MSDRVKKVRSVVISTVVGGIIVWFLLSRIDPRDIPRAIGNMPLRSLVIAFLLYATSVFFKAIRFKVILRTGISLRELFPIISLYMFFANILPMRAGELSYVYLLKKQARTPGTKSFASLLIGGIADTAVILIAMSIVGWHLRVPLAEGTSYFLSALGQKSGLIGSWAYGLMIAVVLLAGMAIFGYCLRVRYRKLRAKSGEQKEESQALRSSGIQHIVSTAKTKVLEVGRELADTPFDVRLLGVVACSIMIIAFRFGTLWYLVRSMGIVIGIWKLSFALLFGVLFSLVPIHGPAGLGTVEAPWVASLVILDVSQKDAITSGFGLHIIIILYCVILGLYGILDLRFSIFNLRLWKSKIGNRKSKTENV